jgi:hypothetical protein
MSGPSCSRFAQDVQLGSDRTGCRSPLANQLRLIQHSGAYWMLLDLRAGFPSWNPLRQTEFGQ